MSPTCHRCGGPSPCLPCTLNALRLRANAAPSVTRAAARVAPKPRRIAEIGGLDLLPWLHHLCGLSALGGAHGPLRQRPPTLHLRRARQAPRRRLAFASYDRHLISITDYPGIRPADALESLLHECVHLSSLQLRRHDRLFRRTLSEAAEQAFGVRVSPVPGAPTWALDAAIVTAIEARWPIATPVARTPTPD